MWERAQRRDNATAWPLEIAWEEAVSLALAPLPVSSLFPLLPICYLCPSRCCPGAESQRGVDLHESSVHCRPFKRSLLRIPQFLLPPQAHWVLQPEVMGIYLPGAGTLGWVFWSGAGITCSQGIPPNFFPPHMNVRPPIVLPLCNFTSPPFLPIWMNVASLNPWMLDFHTAQFSDESGWNLFCSLVVIFAVVACRGEACLPTPPSRPEVLERLLLTLLINCSLQK